MSAVLYFALPRPLGEVRFDGASLVPASALDRINDDFFRGHVRQWLRVALSSETDLTARSHAVSGTDDVYAGSSFCPFRGTVNNQDRDHLLTLGPFPDDLPLLRTDGEAAGEGTRHAIRKPDGRFHYTVYVDADHLGQASGDLCLKITGTKYFSPRAESRVIAIPGAVVRKAVQSGLRR